MAGHSQFKNIMHRKGAQDAKRAKVFTRIGREIAVAAKMGSPDPDANPRLRAAISAAKAANMPNERIDRAIKSAAGSDNTDDYVELRYEGYGPGGIAIIVEAMTDNRNRTAGEVRSYFNKNGGTLGETNSVSFLFQRVGEIQVEKDSVEFDALFETAATAGAEDVEDDDESYTVVTEVEGLNDVYQEVDKVATVQSAKLVWRPMAPVAVDGEASGGLMKLLTALDDNDDVQNVYTNVDLASLAEAAEAA
ncbi:MAG: YebC/PmpR family DNA-binding transcriptional regulator [Alphaproteobacteria bacterium]|nr:YebC/PmpR family DNA-binding transcriptional regulator [Alphaproteobacteria bacterium]